jgi:hypothetical protein
VLAHDPDGWPLPAGHIEATVGNYWLQLWDRTHVWPCHWTHYQQTCRQHAVWRTVEHRGCATWRNFWCDAHLPHRKPAEPPGQTCTVCTGPLDPWLTANSHTTHPCCASTGTVTFDDAIAAISKAFAEEDGRTTDDTQVRGAARTETD